MEIEKIDSSRILVVVFYVFNSVFGCMEGVWDVVVEVWLEVMVVILLLLFGLFFLVKFDEVVVKVFLFVDVLVDVLGVFFMDIVFVGYSMGVLIVCKVYVVVCGEIECVLFEFVISVSGVWMEDGWLMVCFWVKRVFWIVLLVGMNWGWCVIYYFGFMKVMSWIVGVVFEYVV